MKMRDGLHAPIPLADEHSAPFWDGVRAGRLLVQRCGPCGRYSYPPVGSVCPACSAEGLAFEEVSGRASVFSFSETVSGARHPYFQVVSPYLVGYVELEEQEGLLMCSNFPGSSLEDLYVGAPTRFEREEIAPGEFVPQFRVVDGAA